MNVENGCKDGEEEGKNLCICRRGVSVYSRFSGEGLSVGRSVASARLDQNEGATESKDGVCGVIAFGTLKGVVEGVSNSEGIRSDAAPI